MTNKNNGMEKANVRIRFQTIMKNHQAGYTCPDCSCNECPFSVLIRFSMTNGDALIPDTRRCIIPAIMENCLVI